jgi:hypothetical protein
MRKKFIISESEKNDIRRMYGLIKEESIVLPTTVSDSYTATDCDELHAFQSTGGKVIGNMNVTVGKKLQEIYDSGVNPKVTNVKVSVQGMTVTWTVTIDKSNDGKAWVGFTSRGAGCNDDVKNRADSAAAGNDVQSAKSRIESTYGEQGIEIEIVNDYFYDGGKNSFRQIFYRYTKPKNNPPKSTQQTPTKTQTTSQQTNQNKETKTSSYVYGDESEVTPQNTETKTSSNVYGDEESTNKGGPNPSYVYGDEPETSAQNTETKTSSNVYGDETENPTVTPKTNTQTVQPQTQEYKLDTVKKVQDFQTWLDGQYPEGWANSVRRPGTKYTVGGKKNKGFGTYGKNTQRMWGMPEVKQKYLESLKTK